MKKLITILICISILLISCNKNNTTKEQSKNKTIDDIASEITIESSKNEIALIKNSIMIDSTKIGSIKGNIIGEAKTISIEVDEHYSEIEVFPFELKTSDNKKHYIYLAIHDESKNYKKFDTVNYNSEGLTSIFLLGNDEVGLYVYAL